MGLRKNPARGRKCWRGAKTTRCRAAASGLDRPALQGDFPALPQSRDIAGFTAQDQVGFVQGISAHSTRVRLNRDFFASGEDLAGNIDPLCWKSPRTPLAYKPNLAAKHGAAGRLMKKLVYS